mgnify:CR=1 FL=1
MVARLQFLAKGSDFSLMHCSRAFGSIHERTFPFRLEVTTSELIQSVGSSTLVTNSMLDNLSNSACSLSLTARGSRLGGS